jgi:hypothetical protein
MLLYRYQTGNWSAYDLFNSDLHLGLNQTNSFAQTLLHFHLR